MLNGRVVRGVCSMLVASVGVLAVGGSARAQEACAANTFAGYSVVGAAMGTRVVASAPGATIVSTVDGNLPGAQAALNSRDGSIGWAGAPYSTTASDNVGQARLQRNDVPTFAVSLYPADPHEVEASPPGSHLRTTSGPVSSTAAAQSGGSAAGSNDTVHQTVEATALCASDSLAATSENVTEGVTIANVLSLGTVHSTARSVLNADGERVLEGVLDVTGVRVGGQPARITPQGVELAGNVIPIAGNPATETLAQAGVAVHYVELTRNEKTGEVTAPGLEIVVSQDAPVVGSGPATTTYIIGQAYARADDSVTLGPPTTVGSPASVPAASTSHSTSPVAGGTVPATVTSSPGQVALPARPESAAASRLASQIVNWSIAPAYTALGVGALLFVATWVALGRLTARFQWS